MHLVKQRETLRVLSPKIGGFAGWVTEWAHAVRVGAKMRRAVKRQMRVIETLSIGGRKQLVLVSCGGEQFLVGTGADSVQTIVRVHAETAQDETPQARGFGERM
jgi:flagellar biogenesis protein FliO